MNDTIAVVDHGTVLHVPYGACVAYAGRTNIGGVALGFRLIQRAIELLSPEAPPDREAFRVFTAFPGLGVRDAVEMITRSVTRGAYLVDAGADVPGPIGVTGRMFFEVTIGSRSVPLALIEGAISPDFIALGRRCKSGAGTPEDHRHWTEMKEALEAAVLAASPSELLVVARKHP